MHPLIKLKSLTTRKIFDESASKILVFIALAGRQLWLRQACTSMQSPHSLCCLHRVINEDSDQNFDLQPHGIALVRKDAFAAHTMAYVKSTIILGADPFNFPFQNNSKNLHRFNKMDLIVELKAAIKIIQSTNVPAFKN